MPLILNDYNTLPEQVAKNTENLNLITTVGNAVSGTNYIIDTTTVYFNFITSRNGGGATIVLNGEEFRNSFTIIGILDTIKRELVYFIDGSEGISSGSRSVVTPINMSFSGSNVQPAGFMVKKI